MESSGLACDYRGGVPNETVYVELLGEGVDVWRPVGATRQAEGLYRLDDEQAPAEQWAFAPGALVRCECRVFEGETRLVAVSSAG
jgi:hypothetical protein